MFIDYKNTLYEKLEKTEVFKEIEEPQILKDNIEDIINIFLEVKKKDKKIIFIGNGGSAAIAEHMTIDFFKNGKMKTYNCYNSSVITCFGNDYGYEYIFSKQIDNIGEKEDLLVAISSSGNSDNIVNAILSAYKKDMKIITFSGFKNNNKIKMMGNYNIFVPIEHYGIVESIHNIILQYIVDEIKEINNR